MNKILAPLAAALALSGPVDVAAKPPLAITGASKGTASAVAEAGCTGTVVSPGTPAALPASAFSANPTNRRQGPFSYEDSPDDAPPPYVRGHARSRGTQRDCKKRASGCGKPDLDYKPLSFELNGGLAFTTFEAGVGPAAEARLDIGLGRSDLELSPGFAYYQIPDIYVTVDDLLAQTRRNFYELGMRFRYLPGGEKARAILGMGVAAQIAQGKDTPPPNRFLDTEARGVFQLEGGAVVSLSDYVAFQCMLVVNVGKKPEYLFSGRGECGLRF